ncbi:MAG: glycoside hydrolase family 28 protein [Gammaproteobacteria bacterium]|nr:glycoside hydrolase family 28 protein [Gammaproteobacteria bacterium]
MYDRLSRRNFVVLAAGVGALAALPPRLWSGSTPRVEADWSRAERIASTITLPDVPAADFDIRDYGAIGDGQADSSEAIAAAVRACALAGGGRVLVEGGIYRTGPIHLGSNMALHVESGATLSFIPEPERYLPAVLTHWEGLEFMGYSPLIYARGQTNVAITGSGTLDGGADRDTWWPWKGGRWAVDENHGTQQAARERLMADAENHVPVEQRVYADGAYLRPPFIQPFDCDNVLIKGVTIRNAPFWLINPVLCRNVTVRGVTCESLGPNSDGCDPESCDGVLIEDCTFDTGDDCIAIKSGRNADGRRLATPCENIVIRNCEMRAGHGGVVIGSEISGGVRNVFAENLRMSSPDLERAIRIKTNSVRGGVIEHLRYRDITIGQVKDAIVINFYYEEGDAGRFDPTVRDIVIENLVCEEAERVFQVRGFERAPIRDFVMRDLEFRSAGKTGIIEHVDGLVMHDVRINGELFVA